jgi:hypothetical protein
VVGPTGHVRICVAHAAGIVQAHSLSSTLFPTWSAYRESNDLIADLWVPFGADGVHHN